MTIYAVDVISAGYAISPAVVSWLQVLHEFGQPVWKLSWSVTGNVLAVSDSSSNVTLWKEALDGKWQQIAMPAN